MSTLPKIVAALEKFHGQKVSRIEEETLDFTEWLKNSDYSHITELDGEDWHMSDAENDGQFCIAFEDEDEVWLLRELFTKYPVWHPKNVFQPGVGMWNDKEKELLMLKTFLDGSVSKPIYCRFIFNDDDDNEHQVCTEEDCSEKAFGTYYFEGGYILPVCSEHKKARKICEDCHCAPGECECDTDEDDDTDCKAQDESEFKCECECKKSCPYQAKA